MLTSEQVAAAVRYNATRDITPEEIAVLVDKAGTPNIDPSVPEQLAGLVADWQEHHGLIEDGKLGPATAATLTVPPTPEKPSIAAALVMTFALVVARCYAAAKETVYYGLGCGGSAKGVHWPAMPYDELHRCDCSAFADWAENDPRNSGDWNTDKNLDDAVVVTERDPRTGEALSIKRGKMERNRLVEIGEDVREGDIVVFGGEFKDGKRIKIGHIGRIVKLPPGGFKVRDHKGLGTGLVAGMLVAHCSPVNSHHLGEGHAIAVTALEMGGFHHRGWVLRSLRLEAAEKASAPA